MTESEYRKKRKKAHLCIYCGKEDAFTMNGRSLCGACAEKARLYGEESRKDPQKYAGILANNNAMKQRRREAGLCTWCGEPTTDGRIHCQRCLLKERIRYHAKKVSACRGEDGRCYTCNRNPAMPGRRQCAECYEKYKKYAEKMIEFNRGRKSNKI